MMPFAAILPAVGLLPEWILHTDSFQILATFVALNSLMYATLAVLKMLPNGYALSRSSGRNRRTESRSIYPDPTPDPHETNKQAAGLTDDPTNLRHQGQDAPN